MRCEAGGSHFGVTGICFASLKKNQKQISNNIIQFELSFMSTVLKRTVKNLQCSVQTNSIQLFRVPVVCIVTDQTVGPISSYFCWLPAYVRADIGL